MAVRPCRAGEKTKNRHFVQAVFVGVTIKKATGSPATFDEIAFNSGGAPFEGQFGYTGFVQFADAFFDHRIKLPLGRCGHRQV